MAAITTVFWRGAIPSIKVSNWGQYVSNFGDWVDGAYTPHAVFQYFNNGGGSAYIIRVGGDGNATREPGRAVAELPSATRAGFSPARLRRSTPWLQTAS